MFYLLILVLLINTLNSLFRIFIRCLFSWIIVQFIDKFINLFFLHLLLVFLLLWHLNFNSVTKYNAFGNLYFEVHFLIITHLNLIINVCQIKFKFKIYLNYQEVKTPFFSSLLFLDFRLFLCFIFHCLRFDKETNLSALVILGSSLSQSMYIYFSLSSKIL